MAIVHCLICAFDISGTVKMTDEERFQVLNLNPITSGHFHIYILLLV